MEENAGLMILNNAWSDWALARRCCRPMAAALVNQSQLPRCSTKYKNTTHLPLLPFSSEVGVVTVQQRHLWQVKVLQHCSLLLLYHFEKKKQLYY